MGTDARNAPFITEAEVSQIATLMAKKYANSMDRRYFEAEIKKDNAGVYAKVVLRNRSGSYFYPVEGRIAHSDHNLSPRDAGLLLLDYIDAYFEEYFREGGEVYLPIDWADYEWEGVRLQLKGQILNLEVEKMADELLKQSGFNTATDFS